MSYTITVRDLKARMDKGDQIYLLDVREPHEQRVLGSRTDQRPA